MPLTQSGHLRHALTHFASASYIKLQQIQSLGISCNHAIEIGKGMLNGLLRLTLRKAAVGFAWERSADGTPRGCFALHACVERSAAGGRRSGFGRTGLQGGTSHHLLPVRAGRLAVSPRECTRRQRLLPVVRRRRRSVATGQVGLRVVMTWSSLGAWWPAAFPWPLP